MPPIAQLERDRDGNHRQNHAQTVGRLGRPRLAVLLANSEVAVEYLLVETGNSEQGCFDRRGAPVRTAVVHADPGLLRRPTGQQLDINEILLHRLLYGIPVERVHQRRTHARGHAPLTKISRGEFIDIRPPLNPGDGPRLQDPKLAGLVEGPLDILRPAEKRLQFEYRTAE